MASWTLSGIPSRVCLPPDLASSSTTQAIFAERTEGADGIEPRQPPCRAILVIWPLPILRAPRMPRHLVAGRDVPRGSTDLSSAACSQGCRPMPCQGSRWPSSAVGRRLRGHPLIRAMHPAGPRRPG
jgi:hypothetical protein